MTPTTPPKPKKKSPLRLVINKGSKASSGHRDIDAFLERMAQMGPAVAGAMAQMKESTDDQFTLRIRGDQIAARLLERAKTMRLRKTTSRGRVAGSSWRQEKVSRMTWLASLLDPTKTYVLTREDLLDLDL